MFSRVHLLIGCVLAVGCVSEARQKKAASRTTLGNAYLREGNLAGAVGMLEEASRADPRNWSAWNNLGLAYMSVGAAEKAEKAFKKAIKLVPDKAEVLNNYGTLLTRLGRLDEAVEVLTHATAGHAPPPRTSRGAASGACGSAAARA